MEFSGEYTIDIEYDIRNMGDAFVPWYLSIDPGEYFVSLTPISSGTTNAKRSLSGTAVANYFYRGMSYGFTQDTSSPLEITPSQSGDNKDVRVSGIMYHYVTEFGDLDWEMSADNNNIQVDAIGWNTWSYTWEEVSNMYKRGDEAKSGWTMRVAR